MRKLRFKKYVQQKVNQRFILETTLNKLMSPLKDFEAEDNP
jgi:hypothetical protein